MTTMDLKILVRGIKKNSTTYDKGVGAVEGHSPKAGQTCRGGSRIARITTKRRTPTKLGTEITRMKVPTS